MQLDVDMHTRKYAETVSRANSQRLKTDEPDYRPSRSERRKAKTKLKKAHSGWRCVRLKNYCEKDYLKEYASKRAKKMVVAPQWLERVTTRL